MMTPEERTAKIRELNDRLRTTGVGGRLVGVGSLARADIKTIDAVAELVRTYSAFDEENDPHGEHDFGAFLFEDEWVNWKIDYYALDEVSGSEHPDDPNVTVRILSILFASDY